MTSAVFCFTILRCSRPFAVLVKSFAIHFLLQSGGGSFYCIILCRWSPLGVFGTERYGVYFMQTKPLLLAPSLLAVDFSAIGEKIEILEKASVPWLHLDVMDGAFVPNISFGQPLIKSLRKKTDMFFDVHLMINEPCRYLESFKDAGADLICIHVEATKDAEADLKAIKALGARCGVAIKPATPVSAIKHLLPLLDLALVMSVEPGFGGQKFMPVAVDKIKELAALRDDMGLDFHIEVDGGIGADNARLVYEAGADVLVAGSSVLGKEDIAAAAAAITESVK